MECGLEFEWIDVLDPGRRNLPGFFEHSRGFVNFFTSAWQTWSWTVLPWRFWSRVQMHHEVRVKRALVWTLALWLSVWWLISMIGITQTMVFRGWNAQSLPQMGIHLLPQDALVVSWPFLTYNHEREVLASMGAPARIWQGWQSWRNWPVYPAILFRMPSGFWNCVVTNFGFACMLTLLPDTRSRAKLRMKHLVRGFCFGFAWVGLALILVFFDVVRGLIEMLQGRTIRSAQLQELLFAEWQGWLILWSFIWWYFAIVRGYRLERPRLVWLASAIPVLLLVFVVELVVFSGRRTGPF